MARENPLDPAGGGARLNAETPVMNLIRISVVSKLFRNLVGKFKTVDGQWVNCGLGAGSSDLVGWTRVVVTRSMVGKPVAVFTAIEVKVPGARTEPERLAKQTDFIDAVRRDGGYAGFAQSPVEAKRIINAL